MKRRRQGHATLLQVVVDRGGLVKGARVGSFIIAWAMCARELGREPSVTEYVRWWKEPERTAYRHLGEFRELFPELGDKATPQAFADALNAQVDDLKAGWPALAQVPADAVLA